MTMALSAAASRLLTPLARKWSSRAAIRGARPSGAASCPDSMKAANWSRAATALRRRDCGRPAQSRGKPASKVRNGASSSPGSRAELSTACRGARRSLHCDSEVCLAPLVYCGRGVPGRPSKLVPRRSSGGKKSRSIHMLEVMVLTTPTPTPTHVEPVRRGNRGRKRRSRALAAVSIAKLPWFGPLQHR